MRICERGADKVVKNGSQNCDRVAGTEKLHLFFVGGASKERYMREDPKPSGERVPVNSKWRSEHNDHLSLKYSY